MERVKLFSGSEKVSRNLFVEEVLGTSSALSCTIVVVDERPWSDDTVRRLGALEALRETQKDTIKVEIQYFDGEFLVFVGVKNNIVT